MIERCVWCDASCFSVFRTSAGEPCCCKSCRDQREANPGKMRYWWSDEMRDEVRALTGDSDDD
jgi:hypothetical protein